MTRTVPWLMVGFLLVATHVVGQSDSDSKLLPLDPITTQEMEVAKIIASSDSKLQELIGREYKVIYIQSIAPKLNSNDLEPTGRHADLLLLRRENDLGVRVLVDLKAARVVQFEKIKSSSVPLGTSDVVEALSIATQAPELKSLLGERIQGFRVLDGPITRDLAASDYVEGLRHVGALDDPCRVNRCVYLLFTSGGRSILRENDIVVDLNARTVRVTPVQKGAH